MSTQGWTRVGVFYFVLIASIGAYLRMVYIGWLPAWNPGHLVHAHSHVAFQGWFYPLLTLLLTNFVLGKSTFDSKGYQRLFYAAQMLIPAILIAFSLQGYKVFSIVFSSLFQIINYAFIFKWWKDSGFIKQRGSVWLSRGSLILLFLSTLGPWALAVIAANGGKGTDAYQAAIYFYLHFQYNGFFVFALLAVLIKLLENQQVFWSGTFKRQLGITFFGGTLLSYFLSITAMESFKNFWWTGLLGGLLLCIATVQLSVFIWQHKKHFSGDKLQQVIWCIVGGVFILKTILQTLSAFPLVAEFALTNRYIIMGFMHLLLPGMLSLTLLNVLFRLKWLTYTNWIKGGALLFLFGLAMSEAILFVVGLGWSAHLFKELAVFSAIMPVGLITLLLGSLKFK